MVFAILGVNWVIQERQYNVYTHLEKKERRVHFKDENPPRILLETSATHHSLWYNRKVQFDTFILLEMTDYLFFITFVCSVFPKGAVPPWYLLNVLLLIFPRRKGISTRPAEK